MDAGARADQSGAALPAPDAAGLGPQDLLANAADQLVQHGSLDLAAAARGMHDAHLHMLLLLLDHLPQELRSCQPASMLHGDEASAVILALPEVSR